MAEYDVCEGCNLKVANGPITASTWKAHAESAEREVARLQTALEGAEAQSRLRGKALKITGVCDNVFEYATRGRSREQHNRKRCRRCVAIDIKPDEAREKERR